MSITRCPTCDNQYDQDTHVEHEEVCREERLKWARQVLHTASKYMSVDEDMTEEELLKWVDRCE